MSGFFLGKIVSKRMTSFLSVIVTTRRILFFKTKEMTGLSPIRCCVFVDESTHKPQQPYKRVSILYVEVLC